jgi:hypothetical protein
MPYDPQQAAEDFINPGTDLDKLAQVPALVNVIQEQADLHAAEALAALNAARTKLSNLMGIADDLRANAKAIVDATTGTDRRAAFQSLALNIQQLKGALQ